MANPEPRSNASSQAQTAALRRLSARANSSSRPRNHQQHNSCCFSFAAYARSLMDHLRRCGLQVAAGLSDEEFSRLEEALGIVFPPDLRAILSQGLPLGDDRFPDWRSAPIPHLRARCDAPVAAICREVARGRFWWRRRWGDRPPASDAAAGIAAAAIRTAPALIPIFGKCYIPSSPDSGNPVFLVQGAEVSCSGNDLADFFEREAFLPSQHQQQRHCDKVVGVVHDGDGDGDDAAQSSCLSSLIGGRTSIDAIANPLFGSWRKGRLLTTSRSLEASPRPSVSSSTSGGGSGSGVDPPRRSVDVASLLRRRSSLGRKNAGCQAAAAAAVAAQPQQRIEALLGFTIPAPAWAAKAPRRVDVWSDLVDLCQGYDFAATRSTRQQQQALSSWEAPKEDLARPPPSPKKLVPVPVPVPVESTAASTPPAKQPAVSTEPPTKWLDGYLHDMAGRLRTAGWKEDDICEMMVPAAAPTLPIAAAAAAVAAAAVVADTDRRRVDRRHHRVEDQQQHCSRQAVIRDLALKVGQLSDSLKRAGWSVQDVAEALGGVSSTPLSASSSAFVFQQQQHRSSSLTTSIVTAR